MSAQPAPAPIKGQSPERAGKPDTGLPGVAPAAPETGTFRTVATQQTDVRADTAASRPPLQPDARPVGQPQTSATALPQARPPLATQGTQAPTAGQVAQGTAATSNAPAPADPQARPGNAPTPDTPTPRAEVATGSGPATTQAGAALHQTATDAPRDRRAERAAARDTGTRTIPPTPTSTPAASPTATSAPQPGLAVAPPAPPGPEVARDTPRPDRADPAIDALTLTDGTGRIAEQRSPLAPAPVAPGHHADHARAVALQIAEGAAKAQNRAIELRLNPEELGRVRLTMQTGDGTITVAVSAERPETLDLMRRNIADLAQEFRDIGYGDVTFAFGGFSGNGGQGSDTAAGSGAPADIGRETVAASPQTAATPPRAGNIRPDGLDLRL